jgi:hypothetical protein
MAVVYIRPSKFCFLNQRTLVRAAALFLLLRFCVGAVSAQPSLARMRNEATVQETGPVFSLRISKNDPDIGVIRFSRTRPLPAAQALPWLETALAMRRGIDEWRPAGEMVTKDSLVIRRYTQCFRGIRVANGSLATLSAKGQVVGMTLEFFPVNENLPITPLVAESAARERALQHVGARKYVWEGYTGTDSRFLPPRGRLEIVRSSLDSTKMELCYAFPIYSLEPTAIREVMVSALQGQVMRSDYQGPLSCFEERSGVETAPPEKSMIDSSVVPAVDAGRPLAQVTGNGNTRYSGFHSDVLTDNASGNPEKPFRLVASPGVNNPVITLDYGERPDNIPGSDNQAVDFQDNDNNWIEYADQGYYDANNTLSGFDVHFNMQQISEYWMQRHGRLSWNNQGGQMKSYVNVKMMLNATTEASPNAYFNPVTECMYFSRNQLSPTNSDSYKPLVTLDICAHELGHAVCRSMVAGAPGTSGGLRSQGESGALDEGLSDIWGACMDQYANEKFPPSVMQPKNVWKQGAEVKNGVLTARNARSLESPKTSEKPDTYRSAIYWKNTEDVSEENDRGGIHTNCTVLGKWFNLITVGGSGTNDRGVEYDIAPANAFGFLKSETVVYAMEGLLPYDASFEVAQEASVIAIEALNVQSPFDYTEDDVRNVKQAWTAVGVEAGTLYDMLNQSSFLTNNFQCITVDLDGVVWAGTNQKGLYKFGILEEWERCTQAISGYNIRDLDVDQFGVVWAAQSGREFTGDDQLNAGGGAHRFPNPDCSLSFYYTPPPISVTGNFGIVSRNSRQVFINNTPPAGTGPDPYVWVTGFAHQEPDLGGFVFRKGGISLGTWHPSDYGFQRFDEQISSDNNGAWAVGGNSSEVWASVKNNGPIINRRSQLLRYSNVGVYLGAYDNATVPQLASDFDARAIYFDKFGLQWVGMSDGKIVLREEATGTWKVLQFEGMNNIFPDGTVVNECIAGDDKQVYIATTQGLVVYKGMGSSLTAADFVRYTTANGLPSNDISAIAVDSFRVGIWLATPQGIYFMRTQNSPFGIDCGIIADQTTYLCTKKMKIIASSQGTFRNLPSSNEFIFELSNSNGSFENPVELRPPLTATSLGGTYVVDYPEELINSLNQSDYWVRIRSTNPVESGICQQAVPKPIKISYTLDEYNKSPVGGKTMVSNAVCFGADGWDHLYYHDPAAGNNHSDDVLLLSVKVPITSPLNSNLLVAEMGVSNNPEVLQNRGVEVFSPLTVPNSYFAMNRYWKLYKSDGSAFEAINAESAPLVRLYYFMPDLANVNAIVTDGPYDHDALQLYTVNGANPNPDPISNFANCERINTLIYRQGVDQPLFTYKPVDLGGGLHAAELHFKKLPTGGGAGRTSDGGPLNKSNVFTLRTGNWSDPSIWSNGVVPDRKTELTLFHDVTVNVINAICKTLTVADSGNFTVLSGANIIIAGP